MESYPMRIFLITVAAVPASAFADPARVDRSAPAIKCVSLVIDKPVVCSADRGKLTVA